MSDIRTRAEALWRRGLARSQSAMLVFCALVVLLVALVLPGPLQAIVALPVLLVAPGIALQLAIGRRPGEGDRWQTAGLSVIASLALLPLFAFGLYSFHRHLDELTLVPFVVAATAVLAAFGMWRYPDPPAAAAATGNVPPALAALSHGARTRTPSARLLGALLSVVVTGIVILVAWAVLPGSTPARYSAIALAGSWSTVSKVTVVHPGRSIDVDVEVQNHTAKTHRYRVVPTVKGASWTQSAVTLAPGRTWFGKVSGSIPAGGCLHRLSIALRCEPETCTQSLVLWLADRKKLPAACSTIAAGG